MSKRRGNIKETEELDKERERKEKKKGRRRKRWKSKEKESRRKLKSRRRVREDREREITKRGNVLDGERQRKREDCKGEREKYFKK